MPFLRKLVFYLFAGIYLGICPFLILRMLGFVFDPAAGHWVKTGIIYVSSNPPDAKVFLNDRPMAEHTPTVIRDLTPNSYSLRMELDGYKPWENTLPVQDKKATVLENILLIPKEWKISTISPFPLAKLIPVTGNN